MTEDSMSGIIEKVVRETMPRTVRMRVSISQSARQLAGAGGSSPLSIEQTYFETDRGERFFDERIVVPHRPVSHSSSYCDGKKCANVSFSIGDPDKQHLITIGYDFKTESMFGFRDAPSPLRFYHVGLVPLHEALAKAERAGREGVMGRTCDDFVFKDVGPPGMKQYLVYSLDQDTRVPLKIAAYSGAEQVTDDVPNWVLEATSLDTVSGRHFARSSKYSCFRVTKTNGGRWISEPDLSQTIQVQEISFDTAIPKAAFWPAVQPGVHVLDAVAKRKYITPGGSPPAQGTAGTGTPIRVGPEPGSWLPGVGMVLSLAVLAVAAVLWWRRG